MNVDLRNTLTSLSEEKYKDFYYINSHNFFVSPKRVAPNHIRFQEERTSSVGSVEKEIDNHETESHKSISSAAEKNTKAS